MRTRYHRSNLLTAMLAIACLPGLSVPPPRGEVDLAEAEAVANDLAAAGILATDIAGEVGAERFVEMGRAVLEVWRAKQAMGETLTDVRKLLAIVRLKQARETGHLLAGAVTAGAGLDYEGLVFPGRQRAASFGEPVDSRDLASGAGKSFRADDFLDLQVPEAAIDAETRALGVDPAVLEEKAQAFAASIMQRRHPGDFTPPDVAKRSMDAHDRLGTPADQRVFTGVDMAVSGGYDRTVIVPWSSLPNGPLGLVPIRDRATQRAARKARSKVKARRGY